MLPYFSLSRKASLPLKASRSLSSRFVATVVLLPLQLTQLWSQPNDPSDVTELIGTNQIHLGAKVSLAEICAAFQCLQSCTGYGPHDRR